MEVDDDLYLLRKRLENVRLELEVADWLDSIEIELGSEVVNDPVPMG